MWIKAALLIAGFGFIASEAFCGGTITGSIVSDIQKNKADNVVYLQDVKGPVVPKKVTVEQHHLMFIPKVTTIPVGSTVVFTNHDKLYHNVFSVSEARKFNLDTFEHGKPKQVTFNKPGVVSVLCNVHSEMSAWIIVTANQYAAVSEGDGSFTISGVPAGTYKLSVWSEKHKPQGISTVSVEDGKTSHIDIKLGD
jgi:plastocyanin